jgi:hypothetical protein
VTEQVGPRPAHAAASLLRQALAAYADSRGLTVGNAGGMTPTSVIEGAVLRVDSAHDASADLAQLPGLSLSQRVEDQAADLLDMAGRGFDRLVQPSSVRIARV